MEQTDTESERHKEIKRERREKDIEWELERYEGDHFFFAPQKNLVERGCRKNRKPWTLLTLVHRETDFTPL